MVDNTSIRANPERLEKGATVIADGFNEAALRETRGAEGANAARMQLASGRSELASGDFPKSSALLASLVQDLERGKAKSQEERAKPETKARGKSDQTEKPKSEQKDKPMTAEEIKKDAQERGALLMKESVEGAWSPKTQETLRKLFDDISKTPNITAREVQRAFNGVGAKINDQLEAKGLDHRVGMGVVTDSETGETSIYMTINSDKTRSQNALNISEGKTTPTCVKAGTAKFAPEPKQEKPQPKARGNEVI